MILPRRHAQLARKWQRVKTDTRDGCNTSKVSDKGHCAVYTVNSRGFEVPLVYLGTMVFSELLRMSEEESGFTGYGRITLHCDAALMEYVMCLLRRSASEKVEKAFLSSVVKPCQHSSYKTSYVALQQQFVVAPEDK